MNELITAEELRWKLLELKGYTLDPRFPISFIEPSGRPIEKVNVPDPTRSIAEAMVLFDKMPKLDLSLSQVAGHNNERWRVSWSLPPFRAIYYGPSAPTKELAISLAYYQWRTGAIHILSEEAIEHDHTCNCGTGRTSLHQIGQNGCQRIMGETPVLIKESDENSWGNRWKFPNGEEILEFSLKQQRGYSQHPCGCWSHTGDSVNSVDA